MEHHPRPLGRTVPPVVRVLYLLAIAIALLALSSAWTVGALVGLQMLLWPIVGLPLSALVGQLRKLTFFAVAIVVTYALFGDEGSGSTWDLGPLSIDLSSAAVGVVMVLRVAGVILTSQIVRSGAPRAMTAGLRSLGLPRSAAVGLDAVLALFAEDGEGDRGSRQGMGGGGGRGGGMGRGGGGGRGRNAGAIAGDSPGGWRAVAGWAKHLRRGDLRPLLSRLDDSVQRARRHIEDGGAMGSDLPVIVGITVTMLSFKAVKSLPGLPFAPGHKLVVLLPLYVIAAVRTKGRWGASSVGLAMGFASFLMGDGKYGIFEVVKHVIPGVVCDLALPLFGGVQRGVVFWTIFGAVAGAARFAAEFVVVALAQPPAVAYALLVPGLSSNLFFGFLSGYVTRHVLTAVADIDRMRGATNDTSEVEWNAGLIDGGRTNPHPVETDAGISREPGSGGTHRQ